MKFISYPAFLFYRTKQDQKYFQDLPVPRKSRKNLGLYTRHGNPEFFLAVRCNYD